MEQSADSTGSGADDAAADHVPADEVAADHVPADEVGDIDVDAVDLELTRVEESLRLLDDADADPRAVVAWLDPDVGGS